MVIEEVQKAPQLLDEVHSLVEKRPEFGSCSRARAPASCGLMPLVWEAANPHATLAAYAALYLQEEVQAEDLALQIGDISRFLEDLLLGFRLPVFQRRA